jgi:hypothetical protein
MVDRVDVLGGREGALGRGVEVERVVAGEAE